MAFKKERYPPNWLNEIRPRILEREGHCCKFCLIANGLIGWWVPGSRFYTKEEANGPDIEPEFREALDKQISKKPAGRRVRLTTAHLDHGLSDHDDSNLAALCQRCHLNHDRVATAAKRAEGKRYGKRRKQLQFQFS